MDRQMDRQSPEQKDKWTDRKEDRKAAGVRVPLTCATQIPTPTTSRPASTDVSNL
jgi:hypothetical protein